MENQSVESLRMGSLILAILVTPVLAATLLIAGSVLLFLPFAPSPNLVTLSVVDARIEPKPLPTLGGVVIEENNGEIIHGR